jgi:hypothetical protein
MRVVHEASSKEEAYKAMMFYRNMFRGRRFEMRTVRSGRQWEVETHRVIELVLGDLEYASGS